MCKLCRERSIIDVSFETLPEVSQQVWFTNGILTSSDKSEPTNKTQHIFYFGTAIYRIVSLGIQNMQNKQLLHMKFGQVVANQNKKARTRTFYVLKMLYTGRLTKKAVSMLFPQRAQNFQQESPLNMESGQVVTIGVPRPEVVGGCKITCLPTMTVTSCDFG